MEELRLVLEQCFTIDFVSAVLSNNRIKEGASKIKVRPILKKQQLLFQIETFHNNQVFHRNVSREQIVEEIINKLEEFKQAQITTVEKEYTVLISKKGKVGIKKKDMKGRQVEVNFQHNRTKNYLLEEGKPVPFLVELGVMTQEGSVIKSKFDKFRQINRFLEFIEDILPKLEKNRELTILDFGCGKSYLTFAMYYYLHELQGYDVKMIGLDLKKDVICRCNELSHKFGYGKLSFLEGNIADYTETEKVDMVVTLHACDTATDYALAKAVDWQAKIILSVPCCQHELNQQISSPVLAPVLKYGLLKERIAALVTDGIRAEYLEQQGYDAQILEFIDMEHTPKNILIRAVKNHEKKGNQQSLKELEKFLHISPKMGALLNNKGDK